MIACVYGIQVYIFGFIFRLDLPIARFYPVTLHQCRFNLLSANYM